MEESPRGQLKAFIRWVCKVTPRLDSRVLWFPDHLLGLHRYLQSSIEMSPERRPRLCLLQWDRWYFFSWWTNRTTCDLWSDMGSPRVQSRDRWARVIKVREYYLEGLSLNWVPGTADQEIVLGANGAWFQGSMERVLPNPTIYITKVGNKPEQHVLWPRETCSFILPYSCWRHLEFYLYSFYNVFFIKFIYCV